MVLRASITSGRILRRWFANETSGVASVSIDGEVAAFSEDRRAVGWAVRLDEPSVWDRVDPRDHVVQRNYPGVQPGAQLEGGSRRVAVGPQQRSHDALHPCRPRLRRSRDEDVVRPRSESLPPLAVIVDVLATARRRQHRCHSASVAASDQRGVVRTPQVLRRLTLSGNAGYRPQEGAPLVPYGAPSQWSARRRRDGNPLPLGSQPSAFRSPGPPAHTDPVPPRDHSPTPPRRPPSARPDPPFLAHSRYGWPGTGSSSTATPPCGRPS